MMKLNTNLLKKVRVIFLLLGVFVSWYATISAFSEFYSYEGTIFKISNCAVANPVTTPCFWGALAFLGGFIVALQNLKKGNEGFERGFFYFMIFSIIFAWSNFAIELWGVKQKPGAIITVCKPTGSPFLSPCFFGSILFTLSFVVSWLIVKKSKESKS